ncbi:MAG: hypothetical protein GY854_20390 [Deltaproteobacteria bacterium]|nr:hypothetical protein [Deltaproteobacteria bacterium]
MMEDGFSLEDRILCSDGACIGVIGPDGCCKECGMLYDGSEPLSKEGLPELAADSVPPPENPIMDTDTVEDPETSAPSDRVCCPDDMCVGIIGEDGRCGTCQKTP